MNFSRCYRNGGKAIYGFDPNIINNTIPVIFVSDTFFKKLKNEKGEKIPKKLENALESEERFLETSNGKEVRLWVDESDEGKEEKIIYTSLENSEACSQIEDVLPGKEETDCRYVIQLKHGYEITKVSEILEENGIEFMLKGKEMQELEKKKQEGTYKVSFAVLSGFAGILLIGFQDKLWREKNRELVEYMEMSREGNRVIRKICCWKYLLFAVIGMGGGGLCCFIKAILRVELL